VNDVNFGGITYAEICNQVWLQNSEFGLPGVPKADIRLVSEKPAP